MRPRANLVALCVTLVIACATVQYAQRPVPGASGLAMTPVAWTVANSAYAASRAMDAETGLCVASGGYRWGWADDGKLWVEIDSFTTRGPRAAHIEYSTRYYLKWWRNICGDTLPALHTHSATKMPSWCDLQGLSKRPRVPFMLIQYARDDVALYYIQPGQHYILANDSTNYCTEARAPR